MLIQTLLNRVHPVKGFVYKNVTYQEAPMAELTAKIVPRKNSRGRCYKCGRRCPGYDRLPERRFKFVPLWNIRFYLVYRLRRLSCPEHGVVVEQIPWARGKQHTTTAFQVFIARWARLLSWQKVADRFKVSWNTVADAIKSMVEYGLEHRDLSGIESLGVDEMAVGKGHQKYVSLVYQIDPGKTRLLWVGKERKAKTLLRFFHEFGKERAAAIRFVCSDMWKPYLKVIAKKIPQALNILDRFHIMKQFGDAIDKVRRQEVARLHHDGYQPVLTKSRWLLLKRPENLTDKQSGKLRTLLRYNLQSVRAYLLREDFQHFWAYASPTWAAKFLDEWVRKTMLSKIEPMKKVARMLRSHKQLIMNWFVAKGALSSGVVEAMNNTAKLTIRKSFGFRSHEIMKCALYHTLGQLPLPKLTHEFF